ncbi:MAG: PAS domain-containing protein [Deltaproteobacteria bacterium]|nr:PAS domain-containing protein [Deltaproteobacteria bacterium]
MSAMSLHPTLERQLRRSGVDTVDPRVHDLLERVSRSYDEADQDRYLNERSLEVVSGEMQQLYEDLRTRTQAVHAATIEASTAGVLVVDEARRIISHNRAFARMWQLDAATLAGKDDRTALAAALPLVAEPDAFIARVVELYANPTATARDEIALADGRVLDRQTAPVLDAGGRVLGRVWFFQDVTAAKVHEAQLRDAKEAAERASQTKSAFLANMSHELRTPLNSILGFARLLEHAQLDDDQRQDLALILSAGEHMLALVNDLLDLRTVEQGALRLELSPLDLSAAIGEALALVRPLVDGRGHRLTVDVAPDASCALGERRAVVQVLVNLLANAAKFTPEGGALEVSAARRGAHVVVAVKDSGVGIAPEARSVLFTYHTQLDAKTMHGMKGSGIGLALTRELVTKLGGEIGVDSAPGEGSTFRFTLEAAP